jgi:hypothetical protein
MIDTGSKVESGRITHMRRLQLGSYSTMLTRQQAAHNLTFLSFCSGMEVFTTWVRGLQTDDSGFTSTSNSTSFEFEEYDCVLKAFSHKFFVESEAFGAGLPPRI